MDEEPTILPVDAAHARLHFAGLTGLQDRSPAFEQFWQVVRVDSQPATPSHGLRPRLRPVYSDQRRLTKSMCPSGRAVHTMAGSASKTRPRSISIAILSWRKPAPGLRKRPLCLGIGFVAVAGVPRSTHTKVSPIPSCNRFASADSRSVRIRTDRVDRGGRHVSSIAIANTARTTGRDGCRRGHQHASRDTARGGRRRFDPALQRHIPAGGASSIFAGASPRHDGPIGRRSLTARKACSSRTLQELVRLLGHRLRLAKGEAKLNALPQFMTDDRRCSISTSSTSARIIANALPLIMTHGWPGSVVRAAARPSVRSRIPTAHGGSAEDAFDLVHAFDARVRLLGQADRVPAGAPTASREPGRN